MGKIILTDWPKLKYIEANLRGVETERLVELYWENFHLMMSGHTEEAGGYAINFDSREIVKELEFRKVDFSVEKKSKEKA